MAGKRISVHNALSDKGYPEISGRGLRPHAVTVTGAAAQRRHSYLKVVFMGGAAAAAAPRRKESIT